MDSFNIADRCAQILGSYRAIPRMVRGAAARECERFVLDHIARGDSFAVETTLRTTVAIEQMEPALQRGFATHLRFVTMNTSDENIERVLQRAQSGGHAASERDDHAIYAASSANLLKALHVLERVRVYDTTARWAAPLLVATAHAGQVTRYGAAPMWLERLVPLKRE